MVGVMKRVDDNSYLEQRGRVWWYNRRVPSKYHFERNGASDGARTRDLRRDRPAL